MSEPFIGEIRIFGGDFAPRGWAFCSGQLLSISQNTALFSILGTTYGGDGRTTFQLPDLRGRTPICWGQGANLQDISLGQVGGLEAATLSLNELPAHSHEGKAQISIPAVASSSNVQSAPAATTVLGPVSSSGRDGMLYSTDAPSTTLAPFDSPVTVDPAGGGQPFATRSPYLGSNFIIALQGIFPSRN